MRTPIYYLVSDKARGKLAGLLLAEDKKWKPPPEEIKDNINCPDYEEEQEIEMDKFIRQGTESKRRPK